MAEMSPGAALRQLREAHAGLKQARQLMKQARENPGLIPAVFDAGWDRLIQAHRMMAAIPRSAVDKAVLTQQLSVQRYATALLVRLRRLMRRDGLEPDHEELQDLDDVEDGDF
jgi:hypothetical protein